MTLAVEVVTGHDHQPPINALNDAVLQRLPHVAQRAARDHVRTVKKNLHDIELEGHHLIRSAVPLEMNLS
ncbi:MAG: hypothetical protein NVSMB36_20230 [Escherichia coli]